MAKEYFIHDLLDLSPQYIPYYAGTFEDTEDVDVEWPHRHAFYSLVWFTSGTGFYVIDFQEYDIQPNRMFFVTPKQVHNWDYSEDSKGYILVVDPAQVSQLHVDCLLPFIDLDVANAQLLSLVFRKMIAGYENKIDIGVDIQYLYNQIGRYITSMYGARINKSPLFEHFKRLILDSFSQSLSVEEYAQQLQTSLNDLNAICKDNANVTAKQYMLDLKITEAKRLLIFSQQNINEISFALGFEDASYFSRIFKKRTLFNPSCFVKKYRK